MSRSHAFARRLRSLLEFGFSRRNAPIFLVFAFAGGVVAQSSQAQTCPPKAQQDDVVDTYGSVKVPDPFRWLEDQKSPETRAWIDAENKCADAALSSLPGRDALHKRISELIRTDSYSVPRERGGRYFFSKRAADQDLGLIYMRRSRMGSDEVLIDPLGWSPDHSVSAGIEDVSHDGHFLFYSRREGGQDEVTVHVLEVDGHHDLPDVLPSAVYLSLQATPDNRGIYYTKGTSDGPRAYYHAMGTDPAQDKLIFGDGLSKEQILVVTLSDDGRYLGYLVMNGSNGTHTQIFVQNVKENGPIVTVVKDIEATFYPSFGGDTLYIQTNWKAPKWRILAANVTEPTQEHWREVIPEKQDAMDSFGSIGGRLVTDYLHDATSQIIIADPDGKNAKPIALPTLGSTAISGDWDSPDVFYSFTSFSYPTTNFVYDVKTAESSIWSKLSVPVDPNLFETEQVWYASKDGTKVSMFLFHKKGVTPTGANPTILYGYGGFDVTETPAFVPAMIAWAERGGIYAVANLRGGGEYGEDWHHAGMLDKKQNVFDDFIAAAEYLIAKKYTNPSKLAIMGGSNGGLLVGAALTQRPDLLQAVVCQYPLEDMLRYQKFLEGAYWVSEYGSSDDPKQFAYIYKYSPYQNVRKGTAYPSVLFVTGDGDTRVAPLHARKMAALLQADTSFSKPILLLYDTKSGHSGGRPINKIIDEQTDIGSYLMWQLGVQTE